MIKIIDNYVNESKTQERVIKNNLTNLILHMLKFKYQPEIGKNNNRWRMSVINSLSNILNEFSGEYKGSLFKNFYNRKLDLNQVYNNAVMKASAETGLPTSRFPCFCEWNKSQLVSRDFILKFINKYYN